MSRKVSRNQRKKRQTTWQIFLWPIVFNIISTIGILSALIGDHWMDWLSWLCLGVSIILMLTAYKSKVLFERSSTTFSHEKTYLKKTNR